MIEVLFNSKEYGNMLYNDQTPDGDSVFTFEFVESVRTLDDGGNECWYEKIDLNVPDEFVGFAESKLDSDPAVISYRVK